nr:MAG TPA: hypothetical protein [Caudoviricetes sp.]
MRDFFLYLKSFVEQNSNTQFSKYFLMIFL